MPPANDPIILNWSSWLLRYLELQSLPTGGHLFILVIFFTNRRVVAKPILKSKSNQLFRHLELLNQLTGGNYILLILFLPPGG